MKKKEEGEIGIEVYVGGGKGRKKMVEKKISELMKIEEMMKYVKEIVSVYNINGRSEKKLKERIKIIVNEKGIEKLKREIDEEWEEIRNGELKMKKRDIDVIERYLSMKEMKKRKEGWEIIEVEKKDDEEFERWVERNVKEKKNKDYEVVKIQMKNVGGIKGDESDEKMEMVEDVEKKC